MNSPILFIFSGLPAVGKSTLAASVSKAFDATYLRIDTIEQGLRDVCHIKVEGEGYRLAYRIAADNLRLGRNVVADCCNPIALTRDEWEDVAKESGCGFINIEVVCTDKAEHQRRADHRAPDIAHLSLPKWKAIMSREYQPWEKSRITIDTADKTITACEEELKEKIRKLL